MEEPKINIKEKFVRVINNSLKYLNSITDDHINDVDYIPESVQMYINDYVRESRKRFDILSAGLNDFDKSSDEYVAIQKEMENIARTFINVRGQVDKYKKGIADFKGMLPQINEGTQDSNYFLNSAVFGNQWDSMVIDKDGNFNFQLNYGDKKDEISNFRLNEMTDFIAGSSPIITEPWTAKKYVFDLAEKTKKQKDAAVPFDYDWVFKSTVGKLNDTGPQSIIGMAFTDMAGDGQTKSFADMYEEGLRDISFYIHPTTGETLPKDNIWMKDPKNADVLSQLLAKYISDTMKDVYGIIDMQTGQVEKSQSDMARELIEKYSKGIDK